MVSKFALCYHVRMAKPITIIFYFFLLFAKTRKWKNIPEFIKTHFFFRLCFWLDGPLSVSASVIGILINVLSIILMARKRVSKTFHLLMINLSCWDLVSWCVLIDWIKKKWILGFWSTLFNLSSWDLLNKFLQCAVCSTHIYVFL